jgi:peptidyl-tRNA hydrolase
VSAVGGGPFDDRSGGRSDAAGPGAALAPVRERYAGWLALDAEAVLADRDEPAEAVRAMQLVLRLERGDTPSWHLALAAAASGAASLCLDPRAEPGGPWFDAVEAYCRGHIRKVTRRARAGQWTATADLSGLTVAATAATTQPPEPSEPAGDPSAPSASGAVTATPADLHAEVRVLVPGLVTELDPRVSRLQVGGTDVPPGPVPRWDVDPDAALRLWLPAEPVMTLGKTMAQAGHAGMIAAALLAADDPAALLRWRDAGCPVVVAGRTDDFPSLRAAVESGRAAWSDERLLAVRDAGFTEIDPGTVTVVARAPR